MITYLGKEGLGMSWQDRFKPTMKCHKCKGNCRIMFVSFEDGEEEKYVCDLHDNMKGGKYWPHNVIACAVYLCEKCFEPNAQINQA